jgi:hypothetical protein
MSVHIITHSLKVIRKVIRSAEGYTLAPRFSGPTEG